MRFSVYSTSPSFNSISTASTETGMQEIKQLTNGLNRLENKPLSEQRFVPSEQKSERMSKLALGAKVERALERRMTNQDAVWKDKKPKVTSSALNEKSQAIKA